MKKTILPMILTDSYLISPKVKHFILESSSPAFEWIPGQFITIHFTWKAQPMKRSYSLANEFRQDNRLEFAAGFVEQGPGTEYLFNLKPGDTLQVTGPFGRLILRDELPKRYIFVATSTGITPYRAMIPELTAKLAQHTDLSVVFLHGVQHLDDIIYGEDFSALEKAFPHRVRYLPCLSRIENNVPKNMRKGYVQFVFPELHLHPEEDVVYLCGNPAMIDESYAFLQDLGFAVHKIIREKYISR